MRSLVTFSALVLVGCSAPPEGPHDEDAALPIVTVEHDAAPDVDAKADAHVDASAPKPTPSCPNVPSDVSNFKPADPKPARAFSASCGAGQVTAFYDACLGTSSSAYACQTWESASQSNNTCAACMISNDYDAAWGPLVNHADYAFINQAGCAELLTQNPAPAGTCAYETWADWSCQFAACDNLCASAGTYSLGQCYSNAIAGGCKPYDDAQTSACLATGPFNKCFATDPQTTFVNVGLTFCGGS